jgi:cytochrome c oxidase cbb3-type subunit 2
MWLSIRLWFSCLVLCQLLLFTLSCRATADESASWQQRCAGVRSSYNPQTDLRNDTLSLDPTNSRWPAFLAWVQKQRITTFTIVGLSSQESSTTERGVVFRWASGTSWEREVIVPFGQALAHLLAERNWRDEDFQQFFSSRGGIYGINIAERLALLDPHSLAPWQQFFQEITAPASPSLSLLQARLSGIASDGQSVLMTLGPDRTVTYSAARLLVDLRSVLTDCSVFEFFQEYDQHSDGNSLPSVAVQQPFVAAVATPAVAQTASSPQKGRTAYERHCSGCHGVAGDGKGLFAETLQPRPRDFTKGLFRYRSTPTGQMPTDDDLLRTVTYGLFGVAMPAWEPFLDETDRQDVVAYLKLFSLRFATEPSPEALSVPLPPAVSTERITHGEKLYRDSGCGSCHGETGKGNGRAGKDLKTSEGDPIAPRDLTDKWSFRGGHAAQDVFLRLLTGMDGSPMASYREVFSAEEMWDVVLYVLSLSPAERPQLPAVREKAR